MRSTRMDTATPDVPEVETLLVGSDQGGARADRLSPLGARVVSATAVLLLVAGCLAAASTSAREPVGSRAAPGSVVRLVGVESRAKAKPRPARAAAPGRGLVQAGGVAAGKKAKGKPAPVQASESATTLSEEDCAKLRTLYAPAKSSELKAFKNSLKEQGIDVDAFGPGVDPCQMAPSLAKAKEEEEEYEEFEEFEEEEKEEDEKKKGGSSKARRNTTTTTSTRTTSTHPTTTRTTADASDKCAGVGQDCRNATCCSLPGMQCYEKSKEWAQCKATCAPGKDLTDVDSVPWTCKELGKRTPGEPEPCSEVGENCIKSRCCTSVGFACYAKNDTFATCRASGCTPGPDYTDEDGWQPWTCEQLGDIVPGKGPWVDEECANDLDDCREAACCQTSGNQCYEMGEGWAQCKAECSTEPANEWEDAWTCQEIGQRTPPSAGDLGLGPPNGKVASWVRDRCSKDDDDCTHTQCCSEVGAVCYKKDKTYAKCMTACDPSNPGFDDWACEEKGSRSFGVARKTWPSLFCAAVIHLCDDAEKCYEHALMNRIYELGPDSAGIFGCDDWMVLSNEPAEVGGTDTTLIPGDIKVGISKDGTAANTELFMKVWELVIEDGRFKTHDWTVKMDPDAVLLPWKLGDHLAKHTNNGEHDGKLYVVNCNAWPGSESFPMMYGSVEIFSKGAMIAYAENVAHCTDVLPWEDWGEDFFMTRCLDQIDVGRLEMFNVVGDNVCVGPGQGGTGDCSEGDRAAFHPFKVIEDWNNCYNNAAGYHPETPAPPPPEEQAEGDSGEWQEGPDGGQEWQDGQQRRLRTL